MLVKHINPFIRYAGVIRSAPTADFCRCTDCRLYYVISGTVQIIINNQTCILPSNSIFYCCGGSEYRISFGTGASIYSLNFDLSQAQSHITTPFVPYGKDDDSVRVFHEHVEDSELLSSFASVSNARDKQPLMSKIINEFSEQKIFYRERAGAVLKDLLISLHRPVGSTVYKLNEIIKYIHENYAANISNSVLAKLAGYHEYHLNSLFKQYTGINLHDYVVNTRIEESKKLLEFSDLTITKISEQTGFTSYSYYSECFKKIVGIPPTDYRKIRKGII